MPGSYNRCIFVGNLTRDPEMRYVDTTRAVVKFTIAVNRRTKNGDEVTFVDVVAWEKLAEICNEHLRKGASVLVEGRLVIRKYDDKEGNARKVTEIVIDTMQMLDRKPEGGESTAKSQASSYQRTEKPQEQKSSSSEEQTFFNSDDVEQEIPF